MKPVSIFLFTLFSAALLSACKGGAESATTAAPAETASETDQSESVSISLWTFPVGNWGNPTAVSSLISGFHKEYPNIQVQVEYLSYEDGDSKIEQAIQDGNAPDLVLEGPERLVANWGSKGLMLDLSDLWESDTADAVYDNIRQACRHQNGAYYEFPICMTAHCMAINYDLFQEAGALQYLDEETRTWTTEGFLKAVEALYAHGQKQVAAIYCKNQSGDQGTRALVNNLYGGTFTDTAHTSFTIDSEENRRALQALYDLEGIVFEPSFSATDAMQQFCNKETAMTFCWNVSQEVQQTINNPNLDFDIFPMAFPAEGAPRLQSGIWGFGIFDNQDEQRAEASKALIRYLTEQDSVYKRAVQTSSYWPVRDMDNIYANDILMTEYSIFMPYVGDYYQITPGWTEARAAWWQMLQAIGAGTDVSQAVKNFP